MNWREGAGFEPVGGRYNEFKGSLDGQGHTIHYLHTEGGIFGETRGAQIHDINIQNINSAPGVVLFSFFGREASGLACRTHTTDIYNITVTGEIQGGWRAAGIATSTLAGTIENCYVDANLSSSGATAGISCNHQGGQINKSQTHGSISGDVNCGGVAGYAYSGGDINNCYSTADVTGNEKVGGLVGHYRDVIITNCYSIGAVTGSSKVGGFAGDDFHYGHEPTYAVNCYWNVETSGRSNSAGGSGRTTNEMTNPYAENTYVDWNFSTVWKVTAAYPELRWE